VALLNVERIAAGPVDEVFTEENLRKTYQPRSATRTDPATTPSRAGSEMHPTTAFLQ
jgi:ABC-type Mn2+/Zn2+ transport system ATPase subunit